MSRAFFDTNILVYLASSDDLRKQEIAQRLYARHSIESEVVLSVQVLNEFFAVVTRQLALKVSVREAIGIVEGFARNTVVPLSLDGMFAGMARTQNNRLNFWDALIIESALQGQAKVLYTEDLNHGQIIDGLRIENPFVDLTT